MVTRKPLSLYVHIPFCTLKCSYCDFNSYAGIEGLIRLFVDALCEEMRLWGGVMRNGRVETVFFGGGTPSLLPLGEVERIMGAMRREFEVDSDAEVSFEANPGTVDRDYLRGLRALGVNRISFGVQSFHDDELRALDRIHSAEDAKQAYCWAREAAFERINLDLIYGITEPSDSPSPLESLRVRAAQDEPDRAGRSPPLIPSIPQDEREGASVQDEREGASVQDERDRTSFGSMERWQATLEEAIALGPEHLSLYALTVEEGTKLAHDIERGRAPAPDGDLQAEMYEWSCKRLDRAGYRQYEISNWSLPGEECRHNLVYWRNGEWLGVGPGAHSHLRGNGKWKMENGVGVRFADVYSPKRHIELVQETVEARGPGAVRPDGSHIRGMRQVAFVEEQTAEMEMADTAVLGLRLNEGLDVDEFSRRFGRSLDEVYGPVLAETASFGLVERENGRVRLSERGRLLANEVFVRLLAD